VDHDASTSLDKRDLRNRHVQIRTSDVPNIIGVDPGGTTGVAMFSVRGFTSFQMSGSHAVPFITERVHNRAVLGRIIIACQRFVIVGGAQTQQTDALRIIGALESFADLAHNHVTFELQNAADAKKAATPDLLRQIDWWTPAMEHANDAAQHVALTMIRFYPEMWLNMIRPVE
jgi:hypothetical protein